MVVRVFGMRLAWKFMLPIAALTWPLQVICAQDLSPRANVITPTHSNAIILTCPFYDGSVLFNGTVPITGATGTYGVPVLSYYYSLGFFGRSANLTDSLPYAVGTFQGELIGEHQQIYRSGLVDSTFRFSVNLKGGPAMPMQEFAKWKQKALLGVSLKVVAPTGQYSPTKLINWGTNRWSFKPEFGYSRRWSGKWVLDGYAGVWFFTRNSDFWSRNVYYSGTRSQSQDLVGSFEEHLSYDFKPRLWASLDGNYWFGGKTSAGGIQNPLSEQNNSRLGGTFAVPITKHQSLKFSYSNGTYIRFGGDYQKVAT